MKPNIHKVNAVLEREFPHWHVPVVELIEAQTKDPFKVLLTTILSARTKDQTTAAAARRLFTKVDNLKDLERIDEEALFRLITPVGFAHTKAKHLKLLPGVLKEKFGGILPQTVEDLVELPGVGRKTANLVVATAFKKPAICVDVHVHRITNRLGYLKTKTPFETEMALRKKLPKEYWMTWNMYLVAFGQRICAPTSPKCSECPIRSECRRVGVTRSR